MRHVYENQEEARNKGALVSLDAHANWTWMQSGAKILARLKSIGADVHRLFFDWLEFSVVGDLACRPRLKPDPRPQFVGSLKGAGPACWHFKLFYPGLF